jgi:SAM-dependent methyltransferase
MSIHLGDGLYTRNANIYDDRLRRLLQVGADAIGRPLDQVRVLDLACLEGHYAIEFALHGAHAMGIEGREDNLAKARFAGEALGLGDRLEMLHGDVLDLSRQTHGGFDIVLCSGILYHIDQPDVFRFIERIHEVCDRLVIFDTFISIQPEVSCEYNGHHYQGRYYEEHAPNATGETKLKDPWASIDNIRSFWFTRQSLYKVLTATGFTSVLECHTPRMPGLTCDRITLLAFKGEKARVLSSPPTDARPVPGLPDLPSTQLHPSQDPAIIRRRRIGRMLPGPIKQTVKSVLQTTGLMKFDYDKFTPPQSHKKKKK